MHPFTPKNTNRLPSLLQLPGYHLHQHSVMPSEAGATEEFPTVDKFGLFDNAMVASGSYDHPYIEVDAQAILTAPDGTTHTLPLFWDGGKTWRFRFSPDQIGRWQWAVSSQDPGLAGRHGEFDCATSERRGSILPMEGSPNHFQYQNGQRCWFMGDTAWSLVTDVPNKKHDDSAVEIYLKRRAGQGFNVIHTMLLSEAGDGNAGGAPFNPLTEQRLNPAYWQAVDRRLALANSFGIVTGLAIGWARKVVNSKPNIEPYSWCQFPDLAARERYARYIAARYSAFDVYFLVTGEWHGEIRARPNASGAQLRDEFIAIGNALREADPHRRMTGIHPMSRHGSVREFNRAPWMDFADYQQNYRFLHERILTSRFYQKPVVNAEYAYHLRDQDADGKPEKENSLNEHDIRHASWDICMAGGYLVTGFGTTYFGGNRDPGPFDPTAQKNEVWEQQIQYMKRFFTETDYWDLIPADQQLTSDSPRKIFSTQVVESTSTGLIRDVVRPPTTTYWALQIPGETYVVYTRGLSVPATLSIDGIGGEFVARLFNPRTGAWQEYHSTNFEEQLDQGQIQAVGGAGERSGSNNLTDKFTFNPPDEQDWVVLLQRKP